MSRVIVLLGPGGWRVLAEERLADRLSGAAAWTPPDLGDARFHHDESAGLTYLSADSDQAAPAIQACWFAWYAMHPESGVE